MSYIRILYVTAALVLVTCAISEHQSTLVEEILPEVATVFY